MYGGEILEIRIINNFGFSVPPYVPAVVGVAPLAIYAVGSAISGGAAKTCVDYCDDATDAASKFFENTQYSERVISQIEAGASKFDYHSFPEIVKNFASNGTVSKLLGSDGKIYSKLEILGAYNKVKGVFEFIKNNSDIITHRFFNPFQ